MITTVMYARYDSSDLNCSSKKTKITLDGTRLYLNEHLLVYADEIIPVAGHFKVPTKDGCFDIYDGASGLLLFSSISKYDRLSENICLVEESGGVIKIYRFDYTEDMAGIETTLLYRSFRAKDYIFGKHILITNGNNNSTIINKKGKIVKELTGLIVAYNKGGDFIVCRTIKHPEILYIYNSDGLETKIYINKNDPVHTIKGFKNMFYTGDRLFRLNTYSHYKRKASTWLNIYTYTSAPQRVGKNYLVLEDANRVSYNKKMLIDKNGLVKLRTDTINSSKEKPHVFGVAISANGYRVHWSFNFKNKIMYIQRGFYITLRGTVVPVKGIQTDGEYLKFMS